jgi:hypothetical protein
MEKNDCVMSHSRFFYPHRATALKRPSDFLGEEKEKLCNNKVTVVVILVIITTFDGRKGRLEVTAPASTSD